MAKVEISASKCKGCKLCVEACPQECLVMSEGLNVRGVHPAKFDGTRGECRACMNCVLICPDVAIEVLEDDDG